jgi:predicted dehydrogenase
VVAGRRLLAVTALQWRYSPAFQRARQLIGDEPVALVNLHWYWTRPPIQWMWDRANAGGQIVDQNIHLIDLSRALAGEVTSVYAAYNQRQTNFEPDFVNWDGYALTLRYATGAVGTCAGTYALFPEIQERPTADFCLRDRMVRVTDRNVSHFTPNGVETWENDEPLHRGINRTFIAALRTGDASGLITPLSEGLRSTAVALAANRSAETGHPVEMSHFLAAFAGEEESSP